MEEAAWGCGRIDDAQLRELLPSVQFTRPRDARVVGTVTGQEPPAFAANHPLSALISLAKKPTKGGVLGDQTPRRPTSS